MFKTLPLPVTELYGRRQAAKEQLAVNDPLPNHPRLISGTGKAGTRPTSRGEEEGGRTKPGFSRRRPTAGRRHSTEHPRAKVHSTSMQLLKSPVRLRGREQSSRSRVCCAVPSLLSVAWEGCMGHLTPGTSGSCFKKQSGSSNGPDSAPAVTLNCCGLSPSPSKSGWGEAEPSRQFPTSGHSSFVSDMLD